MRLRKNQTTEFATMAIALAAATMSLMSTVFAKGQIIPADEIHWTVKKFAPAAAGTIQVRSELVEADVVARDGKGAIVKGLTANDFKIFDNGKEQKISLFSTEIVPPRVEAQATIVSPAAAQPPAPEASVTKMKPRYIALLMDDTSMPNSDVVYARKAAEQFVRESMWPGDRVGVFTTSTQVTQMFTQDRNMLLESLGKLVTHQKKPGRMGTCPPMTEYEAYMLRNFVGEHTPELDLAMILQAACCPSTNKSEQVTCLNNMANETLSLAEHFGQDTLGIISDVIHALLSCSGTREIVLTSSGFWSQTLPKQRERIIDEALHAGVVINSLDAKGLDPDYINGRPEDGPQPALLGASLALRQQMDAQQRDIMNDPLAQLADATGGRFFHNNNDLGRGLREMAAVAEVSYVLGFAPAGIKADGKFHELKVRVARHNEYTLTARKGYFAPSSEGNVIATAQERRNELEREVMASDSKQALAVDLAISSEAGGEGDYKLRLNLKLGVEKLPFEQREERRAERLILISALFDADNNFLNGAEGILDLSLKDATWKLLKANGVTAQVTLTAPKGKYRLREVVQEEGRGMMSSFTRALEIQ